MYNLYRFFFRYVIEKSTVSTLFQNRSNWLVSNLVPSESKAIAMLETKYVADKFEIFVTHAAIFVTNIKNLLPTGA